MLIHYYDQGELTKIGEDTVNGGYGPVNVYSCANCKEEFTDCDYELIGKPERPGFQLFTDGDYKGCWICLQCKVIRSYPKEHECTCGPQGKEGPAADEH